MLVSTILLTPTTMMASKIQGGIQTPLSVVQQSNSINGTIVDELGEPMIGVTIKRKVVVSVPLLTWMASFL